jgi:hypothetical protein
LPGYREMPTVRPMPASPHMAKQPGFIQLQRAFAAHIRDPEHVPGPEDVEGRRMAIYRELFYNNVEDLMASSFPVLRQVHDGDRWHALIRDYFARHRARTPLFLQMPQELLHYLESERGVHPEDPPFLWELAHYEWVELALMVDTRELDPMGVDAGGDLLAGTPVLSPLAWPLAYRYPVHRIGPAFQPTEAPEQPTYLIVYRDRRDEVGFLEVNRVTARLVDLLSGDEVPTGQDALAQIARELGHPNPDVVVRGGLEILHDLHARDVVLGTRLASS